ncbi:hypothetical protein BGZ57DRAFT_775959 [Hyaloscypha finlandica]|nr:hypothetical protein BGZ57DRAFT_775959 [Hyaloscypha finlandica]
MGKTIRHHSPQHDVSVYEIPCHVGKNTTNALGDMGARHNFMKKSIAHKWGLTINHTAQLRVRLGSGREIYSTEKVTAQFSFLKESQTYELEFWLLPDCVHDVILGKLFLNVSKTFSSVANCLRRVKERVVKRLSHFDLLYVSGGNGPMFKGFLDGTPYLALGDTGAKVAVLDEDQAWHAGISYDTGPEHCTTLRFVDGSKKDTSGTAYGVEWRFGDDQVPYLLDFHILKNAPAKAILPDSLLFSTMAFCRYADFLIDSDDGDTSHCFLIDQDLKRQIETGSTIADLEFQETVRQGEVMDHIASLNEPERQTAWDQERQRRARWALNMQVIRQSQAHGFQASSPQITGLPGTEDARLPGTHCVGPPETHNVEPPGIHGVGPSRNNDVEPLRIQGVWPPGTQNPGSFRTPGDTGDAPDPPSRKRIYWKQVFRWKQAFRFT